MLKRDTIAYLLDESKRNDSGKLPLWDEKVNHPYYGEGTVTGFETDKGGYIVGVHILFNNTRPAIPVQEVFIDTALITYNVESKTFHYKPYKFPLNTVE